MTRPAARNKHLWCVRCGASCHCGRESYRWIHPGRYPNFPAFEWETCATCVHGKPDDLSECRRCGAETLYKNAWKHRCPKRPH
jgi:hypothetical protein